jgi:hypothetical protein
MRKVARIAALLAATGFCAVLSVRAQSSGGALEVNARVTPTAARPEPVRQFTFYVLTKSYQEICKELEASDAAPSRDKFIDGLEVSKELKEWMKAHDVLDLSLPDIDKSLSTDDIMNTPELLAAYQRANSGGITHGFPQPKYKETDKTDHLEKYEKEKQVYLATLKKFLQANPATISGIELELDGVNPARKWALLQSNHKNRMQHMAPEIAQTKYLAQKFDTDLEGHGSLRDIRPGNYWISSLNLDASAGDARVRWDVPVTIRAGQTTRIELTNLNAADTMAASVP